MKFIIYLDVCGLPRAVIGHQANGRFEVIQEGKAEAFFIAGSGSKHGISFRSGDYLEVEATGQSDLCAARFDDFKPDLSLEDMPEWYERLKDSIVSVHGEAYYGCAQGIAVTECNIYGCAVGIVRNVVVELGPRKTPELVYAVRISAKGPDSLSDALKLHQQILTGE